MPKAKPIDTKINVENSEAIDTKINVEISNQFLEKDENLVPTILKRNVKTNYKSKNLVSIIKMRIKFQNKI